MLTPEERKILGYLRVHDKGRLADIGRAYFPGAPVTGLERILSDLEWRGYIVVYYDRYGRPLAAQATERGRLGQD